MMVRQYIELQMWVPGLNSLVATAWCIGTHRSQKSNDFQWDIEGNSFLRSKLPTYLGVRPSFSMLSQKAERVSKTILRKKSFKTSFCSFSFLIIPWFSPIHRHSTCKAVSQTAIFCNCGKHLLPNLNIHHWALGPNGAEGYLPSLRWGLRKICVLKLAANNKGQLLPSPAELAYISFFFFFL